MRKFSDKFLKYIPQFDCENRSLNLRVGLKIRRGGAWGLWVEASDFLDFFCGSRCCSFFIKEKRTESRVMEPGLKAFNNVFSKKYNCLLLSILAFFISTSCSFALNLTNTITPDFTVAADGSGDFKTVQEAINAVPDFRKKETIIFIKKGTYKEKLVLPASKNMVTFVGEDRDGTILTHDDYAQKKNRFGEEMGTTGSTSFYIFGEQFTARDLTFENSAGPVGQAVAVRVDGDRAMFENCRFLGHQDTLYPHGENSRQYYKNCYIEGTTDFIFGWSTAVFEGCTIHSKSGGSYITAASTTDETPHGFVFLNCQFTADDGVRNIYLGRPWRPHAQTVILNSQLGGHIHPGGWHNWNKPEAEQTAFYAEYGNTGPGAATSARVPWSHQLTEEEAKQYTMQNILNGWTPHQHP